MHRSSVVLLAVLPLVCSQCSTSLYSHDCPPPPIPPVPCPNIPPCRDPPCLPDCCPGSERANQKKGGGGGCCGSCRHRKKRETTEQMEEMLPAGNLVHRHLGTIDFATFMDKITARRKPCNSFQLKMILLRTVTDDATESIKAIARYMDDPQFENFTVNCTANDVPHLERREQFCQLTVGDVTCALSSGTLHQEDGLFTTPLPLLPIPLSNAFHALEHELPAKPPGGPLPPAPRFRSVFN